MMIIIIPTRNDVSLFPEFYCYYLFFSNILFPEATKRKTIIKKDSNKLIESIQSRTTLKFSIISIYLSWIFLFESF